MGVLLVLVALGASVRFAAKGRPLLWVLCAVTIAAVPQVNMTYDAVLPPRGVFRPRIPLSRAALRVGLSLSICTMLCFVAFTLGSLFR